MDDLDEIERILCDSNKANVTLIGDGLTRQHFIELEFEASTRGKLYEYHVLNNTWLSPNALEQAASLVALAQAPQTENVDKQKSAGQRPFFQTEIDETKLEEAKQRLPTSEHGYFYDQPEQIKANLLKKANNYFKIALTECQTNKNYELALKHLNKAFCLHPLNVNYYLLKLDCHIGLCDFKSALLIVNKCKTLASLNELNSSTISLDELNKMMNEKAVFCHYMLAQSFYDLKMYMNALELFNRASELCPTSLSFKIRCISCLYAMKRYGDSLHLLNKIVNEKNDSNQQNANLFVLRARINLKNNNITESYDDLKLALGVESSNREALRLMDELMSTAESLRNTALCLSLSNRVKDALVKINGAIRLNPDKPEYNLQRGVLHKRLRDFNACIDDFICGLEKVARLKIDDRCLVNNFQRQILLTYNEFAILCYEKGFYDDAIALLNNAIKLEKCEKGFYVNRGDCFYKKNEKNFALLDYEQANEIDPLDEVISNRMAKVYYECGIEKYDEKKYAESTSNFDSAIKYAPKNCKYYISRARTRYLSGDIMGAQVDICVCIILDPMNPEIPAIMGRVFAAKSLRDVLEMRQMNEAKYYLKKLNIQTVFDLNERFRMRSSSENRPNKVLNHLRPTLDEVFREEERNLVLIEQKKKINSILDSRVPADLSSNLPLRLKPPAYKPSIGKDPRKISWKKFNLGIGSF